MKTILLTVPGLIIISLFLVGCGVYQPLAVAYKGPALGKERIAVLMGNESSEFFVTFYEYTDLSSTQAHAENYVSGFTKQPLVVHMLPGQYLIKLACLHRRIPNISVSPSIKVNLKAGFTYEVQCQRQPGTKNRIIAYVINIKKTESLEIPVYFR